MFAWMIVIFTLAGIYGSGSAPERGSLTLGRGVTVTPANGWTPADEVWDVGSDAVSLKNSGVLVAFAAEGYSGSAQGLLDVQLDGIQQQFGSFRPLPAAETTVADGVDALRVLFSGTADSSDLEGELVVAVTGGTGVVMMAVAPSGQIARFQRDLDQMLASLSIPR